jgi:hypothetical protein
MSISSNIKDLDGLSMSYAPYVLRITYNPADTELRKVAGVFDTSVKSAEAGSKASQSSQSQVQNNYAQNSNYIPGVGHAQHGYGGGSYLYYTGSGSSGLSSSNYPLPGF